MSNPNMNTKQTVTGEGNAPRVVSENQEARNLAEFGMFGTDYRETKRMLAKQLKRYGLVLKTRQNIKWGDQIEMWIEKV
jgi:hypothetical protein